MLAWLLGLLIGRLVGFFVDLQQLRFSCEAKHPDQTHQIAPVQREAEVGLGKERVWARALVRLAAMLRFVDREFVLHEIAV